MSAALGSIVGGAASSALGGLFGGDEGAVTQTTPTTFESLPQFAQQGFQQLVERGQGLAGQDPSQSAFTPPELRQADLAAISQLGQATPLTSQNQIPALNLGQRGSEVFNQAQGLLGRVPQQVDQSNQFLQEAGQNIQRGVDPITGQEIQTGIGQFLNPFTNEVIGGARRDIEEQADRLRSGIGSSSTRAGAFDGTRQAVQEAGLNRDVLRSVGDLSGRLRSQGFESAAGRGLQNLQFGREAALRGGQLGIGQAGTALQGGNVLTGAGQASTGLGSNLFGARGQVANIRQSQDAIADQQRQQQALGTLKGGDILRGQETLQREVPLRQLAQLQSVLGAVPTGGGAGVASPNTGLAGQIAGGLGNAQSALQSFGQIREAVPRVLGGLFG